LCVQPFFETRLFSRLVQEYFSDEEFRRLQLEVVKIPEAGPVIPGSRGVRKLRWVAGGRGKCGGNRVVYFVHRPMGVIWMLTIYPKNVVDPIPGHVLKKIREEIGDD
jgi:hypothetical protein